MNETQVISQVRHGVLRIVRHAAVSASMLSILSCATDERVANRVAKDKVAETAEFYWPYAALAADIYQTAGHVDSQLSMATLSFWLRDEIAKSHNQEARHKFSHMLEQEVARFYREPSNRRCAANETGDGGKDEAGSFSARLCEAADSSHENSEAELVAEEDRFKDEIPSKPEDCDYRGGKKQPKVPIHKAMQDLHWEPVPELQRQLHPRGWSIFVPGLAIDVWRRKRSAEGDPVVVEYALVYRGTVGRGGWLSNFRVLTAFTPFVWDQYQQAGSATTDLIKQIYKLHELSDALFERKRKTDIRVTAVGHSLGGGLAKYVFLRVPEITRVVGFNPSPIDGSSMFSPFQPSKYEEEHGRRSRQSVLAGRKPIDHDARPEDVAMFMLYEEGEILTRLAGCPSGPLWGAEGGPNVLCESVNFSKGNIVNQHNMAQLACKLFLAKGGLPAS